MWFHWFVEDCCCFGIQPIYSYFKRGEIQIIFRSNFFWECSSRSVDWRLLKLSCLKNIWNFLPTYARLVEQYFDDSFMWKSSRNFRSIVKQIKERKERNRGAKSEETRSQVSKATTSRYWSCIYLLYSKWRELVLIT